MKKFITAVLVSVISGGIACFYCMKQNKKADGDPPIKKSEPEPDGPTTPPSAPVAPVVNPVAEQQKEACSTPQVVKQITEEARLVPVFDVKADKLILVKPAVVLHSTHVNVWEPRPRYKKGKKRA